MPEYWDLKILATTESEALQIGETAANLIGVVPRNVVCCLYDKFPNHWEFRFKAVPANPDPAIPYLSASASRFARLAVPRSELRHRDNTRSKPRMVYQAMADARWDVFHMPGVRWAHLVSECRIYDDINKREVE